MNAAEILAVLNNEFRETSRTYAHVKRAINGDRKSPFYVCAPWEMCDEGETPSMRNTHPVPETDYGVVGFAPRHPDDLECAIRGHGIMCLVAARDALQTKLARQGAAMHEIKRVAGIK